MIRFLIPALCPIPNISSINDSQSPLTSRLLSLGFRNQSAIVAYCFHRTILHRFLALAFLLRSLRLFKYEGMTTVLVTRNIHRGGLPTQIAVNTLIVHVIATG